MPVVGLGQKLRITLSETRGSTPAEYMQIISEDGFSMNIVLIAPKIVVEDKRDGAAAACEHCEAPDLHGEE